MILDNLRNKIFSSDFGRNVLTLMTGTAIAQAIPFLIAPVLSRIYSPSDFGRLALYLSVVQILGSIAGGRYELAIVLPKEKKDAVQITLLAISLTICLSLVSFVIALIYAENIAASLNDKKLTSWLYLVPVSVLMIGLFNALNYYNTREKNFVLISKANIQKAAGGSFTQLSIGILSVNSGGLIVGQIFSNMFGNLRMIKLFLKNKDIMRSTKLQDIVKLAKKYIDFPKFTMWGILFNTFSVHVSSFFISSLYNLSAVGYYSYAYKYLGFPLTLIGNSIGQVYFQKLSEVKNNKLDLKFIFKRELKKLTAISVLIFVPLFFLVEDLFSFIFGEEWRVAGIYAKYLIPLMGIKFIVSPLSVSLIVVEMQVKEMFVHVAILLITLLVWLYAFNYELPIDQLIIILSISLSILYVLILIWIYRQLVKTNYL